MRVVLDTAVMVAAIRSDAGASRRLLLAALRRRYVLLLSVALAVEYEAVMTRPEHLRAARLSTDDVVILVDALIAVAEPVHIDFLWRPALADPADHMVLDAAVNGQADLLVTFNVRDFAAATRQFNLAVVTPGEALVRLGVQE